MLVGLICICNKPRLGWHGWLAGSSLENGGHNPAINQLTDGSNYEKRKKEERPLSGHLLPSTSGRDDGQRGRLAGRETNGDIAHKEAASEAHTRLPACMPARLPAVRAEPKPRLYRHRMIQAVSDSSAAVLAALALVFLPLLLRTARRASERGGMPGSCCG